MERFIISTGRSGSTLLTRMVAENRKLLVLNEFIAAMDPVDRFDPNPVSGAEFARILNSTCDIAVLVYERSLKVSERALKGKVDEGRIWGEPNVMPSLAATVFPTLTDEPIALFDEAIGFARTQPVQTMRAHYLALFTWLAKLLGREAWIERSGLTMRWFPELRRLFPNARYLHIHRSGVEAALSMMHHPWFTLSSQFESQPPSRADIEKAISLNAISPEDPVGRFYDDKPPVEYFGWNWSYAIARAYHEFVHLDRDQFTDMWFEHLVADPRAEMARLAEFFELPDDEGWIERAAGMVNADVKERAPDLTAEQLARLEQACLPGEVLLGRKDPNGLMQTYRTIREIRPRPRLA